MGPGGGRRGTRRPERLSHEQQEELLPAHLVGTASQGPRRPDAALGCSLTRLCPSGSGGRGRPWSAPATRRCPTGSWRSKVCKAPRHVGGPPALLQAGASFLSIAWSPPRLCPVRARSTWQKAGICNPRISPLQNGSRFLSGVKRPFEKRQFVAFLEAPRVSCRFHRACHSGSQGAL